ncbi:MAG: type IV pilus twitching motility protein PilT [Peptococcaceae bacterium]|nr:type IV pilus twitching motility protein PilT [Peptococcaceae bacterium]
MNFNEILTLATNLGVSDVHITVNSTPVFRLNGVLSAFDSPDIKERLGAQAVGVGKLMPTDTESLARQIMTEDQYELFEQKGELDFSYSIPDVSRYRVNVFKQQGNVSVVVRIISSKVLCLKDLGLPNTLESFTDLPRGLVLVTGPTGSGKSTTLAAMLDLINSGSRRHIITLEDPIEFVHQHKQSIVNQREIGHDTNSFASALRAAMREDPDVILVGEMRDPETISIAITAAETGHLVFGTLHTSSAPQTIDRIIDVFPPHQQQQIRVQLGNSIQGVVSQILIPRMDRPGRTAAVEILVATPAIRNLIREGKTHQILSQIQTGGKFGMQSMDSALKNLCFSGLISREDALSRALDSETLSKMLI